MKFFKKLVTAIVGLVGVLLIGSFFLPSKWSVQRDIVVSAAPEIIFPYLNNLKRWQEWSPWTMEKYPKMIQTYEGPDEGVGATSRWDEPSMGKGHMTITESDPPRLVRISLDISEGQYSMEGQLELESTPGGTRVTWRDSGDVGRNPVGKYFALMFEPMMGRDFEAGLSKLKKVVESAPPSPPPAVEPVPPATE